MRDRFGAAHALKSPAHITLQMPFRRHLEEEAGIIQILQRIAVNHSPFQVALKGFDCFPSRVIFIRVAGHESILQLHKKLSFQLNENLNFTSKELTTKVHPHMTIATRDLSEGAFEDAWPKFQYRTFEASFQASNLSLLKHNGAYWEIYRDFSFEG